MGPNGSLKHTITVISGQRNDGKYEKSDQEVEKR